MRLAHVASSAAGTAKCSALRGFGRIRWGWQWQPMGARYGENKKAINERNYKKLKLCRFQLQQVDKLNLELGRIIKC